MCVSLLVGAGGVGAVGIGTDAAFTGVPTALLAAWAVIIL